MAMGTASNCMARIEAEKNQIDARRGAGVSAFATCSWSACVLCDAPAGRSADGKSICCSAPLRIHGWKGAA